jgi:hypothetical protein
MCFAKSIFIYGKEYQEISLLEFNYIKAERVSIDVRRSGTIKRKYNHNELKNP